MLDRLDMYWHESIRDALRQIDGKFCIMLDLKDNNYIMQLACQPVEFTMGKDWIKVQSYANDF